MPAKKRATQEDWNELGEHLRDADDALRRAYIKHANAWGKTSPELRRLDVVSRRLNELRSDLDDRYYSEDPSRPTSPFYGPSRGES